MSATAITPSEQGPPANIHTPPLEPASKATKLWTTFPALRFPAVLAALLASTAAAQPAPAARSDTYISASIAADPQAYAADLDRPPRAVAEQTNVLSSLRRFATDAERPVIDRLLGAAAEMQFEAEAAEQHYAQALAANIDDQSRAAVLMGLARVRAWRSTAAAREALADLPPAYANHPAVHQQRARLALLDNDSGAALGALELAARAGGGSGPDRMASIEADRAMALALGGQIEAATLNLAGAGFSGQNSRLLLPDYRETPRCGDGGLQPGDRAIFAVSVPGTAPEAISLVHATRLAPAAIAALGQMLANWEWAPANDKARSARQHLRVSIACSHAGQAPIPDLEDVLPDRTDWLLERGLALPIIGTDLPTPKSIDAALKATTADPEPLASLPWLMLQAAHPRLSSKRRLAAATAAISLAAPANPPPGIISALDYIRVSALPEKQRAPALERTAMAALEAPETRTFGLFLLEQLSAERFVAGQPQDAIRLSTLAVNAPDSGGRIEGWLRRFHRSVIVSNSPKQDPGRAALVAAAEIAPDVCWLKDVFIAKGLNEPTFPPDSMVARISGIVGVEADLTADQQPSSARVVAASPALVFDSAAQAIFTTATAGQPVDCRGIVQTVFFKGSGKPLKQP